MEASSSPSPARNPLRRRFHFITVLCLTLLRASSANEPPSRSLIAETDRECGYTVLADGSVRCELTHPQLDPAENAPAIPNRAEVVLSLDLPEGNAKPRPDSAGPQPSPLPVSTVQRQRDEIEYTQTVFLAELRPEGGSKQSVESFGQVLLIQLAGRNQGSEYREARATLSLSRRGERLPLVLDRGALYLLPRTDASVPLGVIDVPAEGVDTLEGNQLRFRGEMPPGTSGALTLKIPLSALTEPAALDALHDLEFDRAFRRARNDRRSGPAALNP